MKREITTKRGKFEVEMYEKDGLNIISHTSLMKLLNELRDELGIKMEWTTVYITEKAASFLVKLTDKSGAEFDGFGESNEATLENEISKKFPHTIARNRAVDNVFINYLQCEQKFYSSEEIPVSAEEIAAQTSTGFTPVTPEEEEAPFKENTPVEVEAPKAEEKASKPAPKPEKEGVPFEQYEGEEIPTVSDEAPVEADRDGTDDMGDFIIPIGKYKGQPLRNCEEKWVKWALDKARNDEFIQKPMQEAIIAYCKAHNIA